MPGFHAQPWLTMASFMVAGALAITVNDVPSTPEGQEMLLDSGSSSPVRRLRKNAEQQDSSTHDRIEQNMSSSVRYTFTETHNAGKWVMEPHTFSAGKTCGDSGEKLTRSSSITKCNQRCLASSSCVMTYCEAENWRDSSTRGKSSSFGIGTCSCHEYTQSGCQSTRTPANLGKHFKKVKSCAKGRCGPLFSGCKCSNGYIWCNPDNGWCGNSEEHKSEMQKHGGAAYNNPNCPANSARCGTGYGGCKCPYHFPWCNNDNGWCGNTEDHKRLACSAGNGGKNFSFKPVC